ncbi:PREDICTED: Na(+)/H(+) exchange regulatory cofactor NHE-RF1 [Rhagoletis zephyria]|uniref:Na(+)/H(+) exchange regulatory cofactor NHE-RF1 n=1 Tax=Rhagoletis zephyria TaxID=28612 RepID=UPI0008114714|nr:PREDICTED: Na(+)/H(+) exchange regulatory cofactor NHE-RF1 [Rhagoletis zephyria]
MTSTTQLPTKLCHIVKRPDFEGYGFNLHSEKVKPGQFIGKVDVNSPAEASGLKEGDRIIEVNGVNISGESHKQVVQRIKALSNEVRLLIVEANASKSETSASEYPASVASSESKKNNNVNREFEGIFQEIPGSSNNISSISISTKRSSNGGKNSVNANVNTNGAITNNATEMLPRKPDVCNSTSSSCHVITTNATMPADAMGAERGQNGAVKPSSYGLELPMTAAEMRAKLLSRKKYNPKNEVVDLKKKFEIIQKL